MVFVGVTEGANMVKNKNQNIYTKNTVIVSLVPIMLLAFSTMVGSLLSLPGFPPVVYGSQEVGNSREFTWYDRALAINQNNVPALVQKGTDLVNAGEGQQAIIWLDKALKIDPSNMMALVSKGAALRGLGQYQDAIVMYDRVLAIDPNDVYALGGKADSLYGSGHLQQAVAWIDKALEIDPNNGNIQQVKETLNQVTK
jgi:tetratricopeptide (TPR) repeat protein